MCKKTYWIGIVMLVTLLTAPVVAAQAATPAEVVQHYYTALGQAYPSLAATDEYGAALTAANNLSARLTTIDLARMGETIAQIGELLADLSNAFSDLSVVAAQTLPEALFVPEDLPMGALSLGPDLTPVLDEIAAAAGDLALVAGFVHSELPEATFVPSTVLADPASSGLLIADPLPTISAAGEELAGALEQLATAVEARLPQATCLPSQNLLGSEAQAITAPLLAELDRFQAALLALRDHLEGQGDHFFIPRALAELEGQTGLLASGAGGTTHWADELDRLLDTYSTADGSAARLQVILDSDPFGPEALNTAARLRDRVKEASNGYVSGSTATNLDLQQVMDRDFVRVMMVVLAGILLVLVLLLRSLVAPIYMLLTILLSYGATLGITRLVFGGILDRGLTWFVPFLIFVLLMAVGMDYNIFIMGRVKEEVAGSDVRSGVRRAVQHTGGIIASAGIIMAATFAAMLSSSLQGLVQLAFAIAVGVLLDAFVVVILVSSIAVLLGRWNWWPWRGPRSEQGVGG